MNRYQQIISSRSFSTKSSNWIEAIIINCSVLLIAYSINPDDPLFLNELFPWPILAPILVALRYGFFFGFISTFSYMIFLILVNKENYYHIHDLPFSYLIGLTLTAMIAGETRDYWQRQIDELTAKNNYRQIRLDEFTLAYHILQVSHEKLEHQLAGSGKSLRQAIAHVQKVIFESPDKLNKVTASKIITILSEYGNLQKAVLCPVTKNTVLEPLAEIGGMSELDLNDFLILRCLEIKKIISIDPAILDNNAELKSSLLIAIPLVDSQKKIWGVVAVESLPFFSLQEKTLALLGVMAGNISDALSYNELLQSYKDKKSKTMETVYWELILKRALIQKKEFDINTTIIIFKITQSIYKERAYAFLRKLQRGLDVQISWKNTSYDCIAMIMPLTDEVGFSGYFSRLEEQAKSTFGKPISEIGVSISKHYVVNEKELSRFFTENLIEISIDSDSDRAVS